MDTGDTEKKAPTKKRLRTLDIKAVRESLCKLAREVYNGAITESRAKTTAYILGKSIEADRIMCDIELKARIDALEKRMSGAGNTTVDQKELESPYAMSLKKELENERRQNQDMQSELLALKRQLAEFKVNSGME
jgi:hypothetical protein